MNWYRKMLFIDVLQLSAKKTITPYSSFQTCISYFSHAAQLAVYKLRKPRDHS